MRVKTFLILEDEPFIAMDLQHAFEDGGHRAFTAVNIDEAMDLLQRETFDGAVLDVNLGRGMTCEPVADALRDSGIPFILHTGDLDRVGEFLRRFGAPVIAKPTPSDDVVEQIAARVA